MESNFIKKQKHNLNQACEKFILTEILFEKKDHLDYYEKIFNYTLKYLQELRKGKNSIDYITFENKYNSLLEKMKNNLVTLESTYYNYPSLESILNLKQTINLETPEKIESKFQFTSIKKKILIESGCSAEYEKKKEILIAPEIIQLIDNSVKCLIKKEKIKNKRILLKGVSWSGKTSYLEYIKAFQNSPEYGSLIEIVLLNYPPDIDLLVSNTITYFKQISKKYTKPIIILIDNIHFYKNFDPEEIFGEDQDIPNDKNQRKKIKDHLIEYLNDNFDNILIIATSEIEIVQRFQGFFNCEMEIPLPNFNQCVKLYNSVLDGIKYKNISEQDIKDLANKSKSFTPFHIFDLIGNSLAKKLLSFISKKIIQYNDKVSNKTIWVFEENGNSKSDAIEITFHNLKYEFLQANPLSIRDIDIVSYINESTTLELYGKSGN